MAGPVNVILLLGPTASGKTALSLEIARALGARGVPCEIVSADSMQAYVGMDIGTAKPSLDERRGVPHHMIDVADPYSAGFTVEEWLRGARAAIGGACAAGHVTVVTGGTNLYVQALVCGLFQGPPASPELRARLGALSPEELRARLERGDPDAARRIHRNDIRRAVRALEVLEITGSPISALQVQWESRMPALPEGWRAVGLMPSVGESARRINARVGAMIDAGFVDEVRSLRAKGDLGRQAAEAVGYREIARYLDRRCSLHDAAEAIKVRTRRLARQQRTWLRRFHGIPGSTWLEAGPSEGAAEIASRALESVASP